MGIKNTATDYGSIAKWFHWLTALLFLVSYCAIYYREWIAKSDFESWLTIQLHLSVGISLAGIVSLRIIWRILNRPPKNDVISGRQQQLARLVHFGLYSMMFIMPLSGYLSIANYLSSGKGQIDYFFIYPITMFENVELFNFIGITLEQLEQPAELIHEVIGRWILSTFIVGHIAAALYHHFINKDNTLIRMTFQKS
ncbi:cytochrome b [Thalassotalea sp. G2M2-11]|uniref:cytochrome b n=1 Tax=Thalassotalea sp. G2M2-11 TaxID=2787627 RepID=UPI0019D18F5A|nr:cytochrome b [Thalassotalea sp. G2M2-11]